MIRVLAWPFDTRPGNPYTWLLYDHLRRYDVHVDEFRARRVLRGAYDVWHMHWPEGGFNTAPPGIAPVKLVGLVALIEIARLRGIRLVWTVHNLGAHETRHPVLEQWFWRYLVRRVDGWVSLSDAGRQAARRAHPELRRKPCAVIPHGHYRTVYPDVTTRAEARHRLGVPSGVPLVVHLGTIRPYKNVPRLIETFRELPGAARLLVAGHPQSDALAEIIRAATAGEERVRLDLRFIPEEDVQYYLRAADVAALPYIDILHSGSALLALSFDCPILLPDRGAMSELQAAVGPRWVRTYEGPLTADVLQEALGWARDEPRPERAPLDALSWETIARQTLSFYRRLL